MFIQSVIRRSSSPPGIPLAHPSSAKLRQLYEAETLPELLGLAIALERHQSHPALLVQEVTSWCERCGSLVVIVLAVGTVRALYAGTLATIWTTAPSLRPSARLAACLLLATLTTAARCYANATHHPLVVQQRPSSSFSSPIDDSSARVPHSSTSVVLISSRQPVQSDTSVIVINSKKLLHNQNPTTTTTTTTRRKRFRTKRELRPSLLYNRIADETTKTQRVSVVTRTILPIDDRLSLEKRSDVVLGPVTGNSETDSVGDSDRVNETVVNTVPLEGEHQNDSTFYEEDAPSAHSEGTERPMPPVHDHGNASLSDLGILVLVLSAIVLTVALGLITCVLSHYRPVAGEGAADGGTAADPHDAARTPTTAPMLSVVSAGAAAGVGGMDRLRGGRAARELAATRDRQVRLHAVHTDIAINLPPNIAMPDGEEHPFTSSRLHIRDPEQESEIHQKCIRPPPNRTVLESESPPPYRSSSAGLLGSSTSSSSTSSSSGAGGDWSGGGSAPLVVRCHSMSSSTKRPEAGSSGQKTDFLHRTVKIFTGGKKGGSGSGAAAAGPVQTLPVVIVPTRPRRTSSDQQSAATPRSKPSV